MRRRRQATTRTCLAGGCRAEIVGWKRLCDDCFKRLPFDQRKAIAEAGQARAPHLVAQLVTDGIAWLAAHPPAAETARRMGERIDL